VAGFVFGPPGWRPDGAGQTTEALRAAAGALEDEPGRAASTVAGA
jgi:hypothetical protein